MAEPAAGEDGGWGRIADLLDAQAQACGRLGSPMYADLMARAAADVRAGGVVADVLAGHERDAGPSALALRLFGAVHRLVLERRAPALAVHYPSVGGRFEPEGAWAALQALLAGRPDDVRALLDQPPQTNEVARGPALVGALLGLVAATRLPVRLVELGASAGLNLRADAFRVEGGAGAYGDPGSPVRLEQAWDGARLPVDAPLRVLTREGCDVNPIDPTTTEGRLLLTSYVWPDQTARLERLRGALRLAERIPAPVARAGAAEYLRGVEPTEGVLTVVWHSVVWQYLAAAEREAVRDALARLGLTATPTAPVAHVALEPRRRSPEREHEFLLSVQVWPGDGERIVAVAHAHGVPVEWECGTPDEVKE